MFEEFTKPSQSDWEAQLEKELKGASLESKDWVLGDGTISKAFYFPNRENSPAPLVRPSADWQICEDVDASITPKKANRKALAALEGGAEGLVLHIEKELGSNEITALLKEVFLDYVGLHFRGKAVQENPSAILSHLISLCAKNQTASTKLSGSLGLRVEQPNGLADYGYAAKLLPFAKNSFPNIKLFNVQAAAEDFSERPSDELLSIFQAADRHFDGLTKQGANAKNVARSTAFSLEIGSSYFVEIAKLRAFSLLWLHFQKAWGISKGTPPELFIRFRPEVFTDDIYSNMIRATTMAMSAVLGGASQLVVLPHDEGHAKKNPYGPDFSKRIARNVQHLLKSESYLNQMVDPAAGSYYLEDLTEQMAQQVWGHMALE